MLQNIFFVTLGALLGALLSRQYDQYRAREEEGHVLKLAFEELENYHAALLSLPVVGWNEGPHQSTNENLRKFLSSKLALLLPLEVRAAAKQIADSIDYHNHPKNIVRLDEIPILEDIYSSAELLMLNSILYISKFQYRMIGGRPSEAEILRMRNGEEKALLAHDLHLN